METEMEYRGSKSEFNNPMPNKISVKEQRVDGSLCFINKHIRCTLTGFERNYQVRFPSKQLNNRRFTSLNILSKLNPFYVTGLVDAEGSFSTTIYKSKKYKLGWCVQSYFQISLHSRDLPLLLELQKYFGGIGSISKGNTRNTVSYSVSGIKDLTMIIIPHFDNFPLLTQKGADFLLFKQIVELIKNKQHLNIEGLLQIINIKATMNLGLSDIVKSNFNNIIPVNRPIINTTIIPDPQWVAGFVCGEGNFGVKIKKSKKNKIGYQIQLIFILSQHHRDIKLMEILKKYFGSGTVRKDPRHPAVYLILINFSDLTNKIIPLFEKYPIFGIKQLDFLDWCKVAKLMNEDYHLTTEGLNLIRTIKNGMNKGRKF
jgi:LAGLIDADG endonuclease